MGRECINDFLHLFHPGFLGSHMKENAYIVPVEKLPNITRQHTSNRKYMSDWLIDLKINHH